MTVMMTQADYERLRVHLDEVEPLALEFCNRHGFSRVPRERLGRYPRLRVNSVGRPSTWIELSMDLDGQGKRFELFRPGLPYSLHAGVYLDVYDTPQTGTRFYSPVSTGFVAKPFEEVGAVLIEEMEKLLPDLAGWDANALQARGKRSPLGLAFLGGRAGA